MAEPIGTGGDDVAAPHAIAPVAEVSAAISFLTRIPIGRAKAEPDRTGAAAFAVVGAIVGLVAAIPILALGRGLALPTAVLALLVIVVLTGGLHLDGLADTADALAAPTPEAAERARMDPRAGAIGVAAIVLDLLLTASFLATITARDPRLAAGTVVVAASWSRAAAPIAAWATRIRRAGRHVGLGGWFVDRVRGADAVVAIVTAVAVTVVASVLAGVGPIWLGVVAGLTVAAASSDLTVARRGQLDGDGFGAIVEITFVCILGGVAVQAPAA